MPYSVHTQSWPTFDPALAKEDLVELVIQVNGKVRDRLTVRRDLPEAEARELAMASDRVRDHLDGQEPARVVYVPGRLVNVVVR